MICQRCQSERILRFSAKCSDMFSGELGDKTWEGYVPAGVGIGGGDYIEGDLCLTCGQLQGMFPITDREHND